METDTIPNTDNVNNGNILKDSKENDQPTIEQHQHQQHSVEPTKETQTQQELANVVEKLKEITAIPSAQNDNDRVEKKRQVKNIENPFKNLTPKGNTLIIFINFAFYRINVKM